MQKQSPLQRVRSEHGDKAKLADKVLAKLDTPEGEDKDAFQNRIKTLSNAKLLRLLEAQQTVESKYGSKDELVKKIVAAKFSGGNVPYETKIRTFTLTRLLDLARQVKA